MGLDITVMIVDWSWLSESPPPERLPRPRDAWYDDETGFWDHDAPAIEEGWNRPRGPHGSRFAVYEFPDTSGSFKTHFRAGQRWEKVREHADPSVRAELDTLLSGLIWYGPDGEADPADPDGFFGDGPGVHGMLLAQSPDARPAAARRGPAASAPTPTPVPHQPGATHRALIIRIIKVARVDPCVTPPQH
jgi:hypothetical protein